MRKRSSGEARLWRPRPQREPRFLTPGELDYPAGLLGERLPPARTAVKELVSCSCQQWERAVLGALVTQPLLPATQEAPQFTGERYLARLWAAHREHFGQHDRAPPTLLLTEELRVDTLGQYLPEQHLICVRPSALTRHVLVHEACHAWTGQGHGAPFALGMLYLMEHEFECERATLLAQAREMGLPIKVRN